MCLYLWYIVCFFFFKQKTAYEMRISDWSSDVCSSDLKKLRLTGGEPLVRRDIMKLFHSLSRHLDSGALEELTLTTNGSQLSRFAHELAGLGVKRVNVSLDTLNPDKFQAITRWGKFDKVMEGLAAAKDAGLQVKINAVALKGVNDDEVDRLVAWCGGEGYDLTFIEVMPMGEIGEQRVDQYWPLSMLRAQQIGRESCMERGGEYV